MNLLRYYTFALLSFSMKEEVQTINYRVIFSSRKTIGISIRSDASVIVRVPYKTAEETIKRIVGNKSKWIIKHTTKFLNDSKSSPSRKFINGEKHFFRGKERLLVLNESKRPYCRFYDGFIEIGYCNYHDPVRIKKILYSGYKKEAEKEFPALVEKVANLTGLKPAGLRIRTMKSRWGSCSSKGTITLNTELIRFADEHIIYVITHELCHLKHHNHGKGFYTLLSFYSPEWRKLRKEIRRYIPA